LLLLATVLAEGAASAKAAGADGKPPAGFAFRFMSTICRSKEEGE
jgi:hypothetical protein